MSESSLLQSVVCPQCEQELARSAANLRCEPCNVEFPQLGKIPWITPYPQSQLLQWHHRYKLYLEEITKDEQTLKLQQKVPSLLPATQSRLSKLLQTKIEHRKGVEKILNHLDRLQGVSRETLVAAQTKLPETFSLMGYYTNVLRDWAWPGDENEICADIVSALLSKGGRLDDLLVLGSGGSRLAFDVQRKCKIASVLATDLNPFLLSVAEWMVRGNKLTLCDFPVSPLDDERVANKWTLQAPEKPFGELQFAAIDALHPPFRPNSVGSILTPWLIDVIPQDSRMFFARLNHILAEGGVWVNFGTLAYYHRDFSICYGFHEIESILQECGFELIQSQRDTIPYMANPSSAQRRQETTFSFVARKVKSVPPPKRFQAWPDWVADDNVSIPNMPKLREMAQINATFNTMVAGVDGQKTLQQLAEEAAPKLGVQTDQAIGLIRQLLMRIYEGSQRAARF